MTGICYMLGSIDAHMNVLFITVTILCNFCIIMPPPLIGGGIK